MRHSLGILGLVCLGILPIPPAPAQSLSAPFRETSHQDVVPDKWSPEKWSNGFMVAWSIHGISTPTPENIVVWSPDRGVVRKINVQCDAAGGASFTMINDVAVSSDGRVAAVGTSIAGSINVGFLAEIRLSDGNIKIVQTAPFFPSAVVFGPDNTLWLSGTRRTLDGRRSAEFGDYRVVQHRGKDDSLISESLPYSSMNCAGPNRPPKLISSADRIGLFWPSCAGRFIEMGLDGAPSGSWSLPVESGVELSGVAMTEDGTVYAENGKRLLFYRLDRTTSKWLPVSQPPNQPPGTYIGYLSGAEGPNLIFALHRRLYWAKVGTDQASAR